MIYHMGWQDGSGDFVRLRIVGPKLPKTEWILTGDRSRESPTDVVHYMWRALGGMDTISAYRRHVPIHSWMLRNHSLIDVGPGSKRPRSDFIQRLLQS
jgi:hypothetical protein